MTKNEALKMAIEAMTSPNNLSFLMAITACKEALEQPTVAELNDEYLRDTHVEGLQPKEPQYLYAYKVNAKIVELYDELQMGWDGKRLLGKIPLIVESNDD